MYCAVRRRRIIPEPGNWPCIDKLDIGRMDGRIFSLMGKSTWVLLASCDDVDSGPWHYAELVQKRSGPICTIRQRPNHPLALGMPAGDAVIGAMHLGYIGN
jgi:hypothetical protein